MSNIETMIKNLIIEKIQVSHLVVEGDGSHFQAVIVSNMFDGKNRVDRHKLVYDALGNCFEKEVHAFSFKTYTEDEWKSSR